MAERPFSARRLDKREIRFLCEITLNPKICQTFQKSHPEDCRKLHAVKEYEIGVCVYLKIFTSAAVDL